MSEVTERTPESVQSQIKRTRHKAEVPLYIISIILGSIALIIMYAAIFGEYGIVDKIKEGLTLADITEANPEFGHLYLHHVQIYYNFWSSLAVVIPVAGKYFLAPLLSRAREYSADRVAQALTGECGTETMMFITAGRHIYKYTNAEDYMAWVNKDKNFIEKFARFVKNMLSSHPVTPFRTKAILDPTQKSGRLL